MYVLKWSVILTSLALKNGVKDIQTAGYNGARTVFDTELHTPFGLINCQDHSSFKTLQIH